MVYSMRQTFECKWTGNTALNYDIQKKEVQPQSLQASMLPITMNINSFQKARCSSKVWYFNTSRQWQKIQTVNS